jgi:hypothetical protein
MSDGQPISVSGVTLQFPSHCGPDPDIWKFHNFHNGTVTLVNVAVASQAIDVPIDSDVPFLGVDPAPVSQLGIRIVPPFRSNELSTTHDPRSLRGTFCTVDLWS